MYTVRMALIVGLLIFCCGCKAMFWGTPIQYLVKKVYSWSDLVMTLVNCLTQML
jgi:hypothetical protein